MRPTLRFSWPTAGVLLALLLAGCAGSGAPRSAYEPEEFDSTTTHTRTYLATEAQTCEAARRALLSQGYLISAANSDLVTGRKSFQPDSEMHVEVEFRVVCAREGRANATPRRAVAFATALQDRYSLKKTNSSASVGVGMIGSLSLPFSASDDALVKVASQTLTDQRFYDRFFALLDRFLAEQHVNEEPAPGAAPQPAVLGRPAAPAASINVPPLSRPATNTAPAPVTVPVLPAPDRG